MDTAADAGSGSDAGLEAESDDALTARVEAVERDSYVELYTIAAPLGTGWLELDGVTTVWSSRDEDASFSCVTDLTRVPDPDKQPTLLRIEQEAAARGAEWLGIDIPPPLAAWATHERLTELGYVPNSEESIQVGAVEPGFVPYAPRDGVAITTVTADERDTFARTLNVGFDIDAEHARGYVFASTIGHPGWWHYLAWIEGQPASASVLYVTAGVGDLFITGTVPAWRGRGAQAAMIERRINDAALAGCDVVTSQTVVGTSSPRNMQRYGLRALYTRAIYGKKLG
jgi:hypothetical protein